MNRLVSARTALVAAGADLANLADVVKWNVYVVAGQPLKPAYEAFQRARSTWPNPTSSGRPKRWSSIREASLYWSRPQVSWKRR
jgi:hypothetical protein